MKTLLKERDILLQQRDELLRQIKKNELGIGKKIETAYKNWKISDNKEAIINYLQYKIVEDNGLTAVFKKRTPIEQIAVIKSLYQRICNTQRKYIKVGWCCYYPKKKFLGRYEKIKITQQQIEKLLQMLETEIN